MSPKRRKKYTDGSPEITVSVTLDQTLMQQLKLSADREGIDLDEAIYATLAGSMIIRSELLKLPQFKHRRLVSKAEGASIIGSLIKAEVLRQKKEVE